MAYTTINKPSLHFNTKLYTGTGATNSVTGVGFQPDFTWIKNRSGTDWHRLTDAVRGATKELYSNATNAEATLAQSLQTFNADGFTLGTQAEVNRNGNNFVSWNWKASNTTAVVNTQGTLTTNVSANQTAGFSVCRITEAGSYSGVQTFGHGLGVAPSMVIYKQQNTASNWQVYHKSTGVNITQLNNTGATSSGTSFFPAISSTTVSIGEGIQAPTYTSIAYCFADVKGFSKFSSYVGNGNANGTFVYTGFKPAYLMIKNRDQGAGYGFWCIWDNKRNTNNPENIYLTANVADADNAGDTGGVDFLSNGFKIRNAYDYSNGSGINYIYMAFAEQPLVGTNNVPCTAR